MSLKKTINQRRKEGESTKVAAERLAADKDAGVGHDAAKIWLANKARKPAKKHVPKLASETAAFTTTNSQNRRK